MSDNDLDTIFDNCLQKKIIIVFLYTYSKLIATRRKFTKIEHEIKKGILISLDLKHLKFSLQTYY